MNFTDRPLQTQLPARIRSGVTPTGVAVRLLRPNLARALLRSAALGAAAHAHRQVVLSR